jgi:Ankyrin repeat
MATRTLPTRPDLTQLKRQATELRRAHREHRPSAGERIVAHHPRWSGASVSAALEHRLSVADSQLVIAREYGFPNWAGLKHTVELVHRLDAFEPHPDFERALAALDAGDVATLRAMLAADPRLVHARTNLEPQHGYFAGATLLHHVAGNPGRDPLPDNIVEVARALLEAGADVAAETLGTNGGTTMGLLLTSAQASERGVSGPLIDLLVQYGAKVDVERDDALDGSITNHAPHAAEKLIELGAKPDLFAAAALGRMDLLRRFFDERGNLRTIPHRHGREMKARDAIGLALLYAYVRKQADAFDFLLERDGNWNMTGVNNGAVLHRAAYVGDLAIVQRLVAKGADIGNRDNPFHSTPLSWAAHGRQQTVFDWMRANCAIDMHDAVCHDLPEHVEARLREAPDSVNRRLDQWDIPRSAPLHWAAWPRIEDDAGEHEHDRARRLWLVEHLLDNGADIDAIAGNGMTALDIAMAGGATAVAEILVLRGGHRAADL